MSENVDIDPAAHSFGRSVAKQLELLSAPTATGRLVPGPSPTPMTVTKPQKGPLLVLGVFTLLSLGPVLYVFSVPTERPTPTEVNQPTGDYYGSVEPPVDTQPPPIPLTLPETGIISTSLSLVAEGPPFKLVTPPGNQHYFARLVDASTDASAVEFFVRAGDNFTVRLTPGTYYLRYAFGETWYGQEARFGPNTQYAKADTDIVLSVGLDGYEGVEIELIEQLNGNLHTVDIDASTF